MNVGEVVSGTVARLVTEKGFGFITCDDGGERFFHMSAVKPESDFRLMQEHKTRVQGTIQPGNKGKGERLEGVVIIDGD